MAVGTTYLLQHASKRKYALCTGVPFIFVVVTVFTASMQSILNWWTKIGEADAPEDASPRSRPSAPTGQSSPRAPASGAPRPRSP